MVHNLLVKVIHSKKLSLRTPTLTTFLDKLKGDSRINVSISTVESFEVDDINMGVINTYVKLDNPETKTFLDSMVKNLHVRQVSQCLKHADALKQFHQNTEFDTLLVIEDDILFSETVIDELLDAVEVVKTTKEADILLLGCPTPKSVVDKKVVNVKDVFRIIPTMDSYLIRKDAVEKVLKAFLPIRFATNVQCTFLSTTNLISAYMYVPNIFVNGSKYGVYLSSTDINNRLFMNQDYNVLVGINTKPSLDTEDIKTFNGLLESAKFKEHPDFQYQIGIHHARVGQIEKSKLHFDTAFKVYNENECIMTNESEFLLNYSRLFKYFQDA
jgi:GR25 family glycosyltransferase involved in LPS biosynthesis